MRAKKESAAFKEDREKKFSNNVFFSGVAMALLKKFLPNNISTS